jgi:hypothetical protein
MIRETYRGRKLTARNGKGHDWGKALVTCNGESVAWPTTLDLPAALASVKAQIDFIDREPVNGERWQAHWYAPGTYEMCPEEIHPQVIGGPCQHFTCVRKAAHAT